jgi:GntP family gluconate:H+ symporter
MSTTYILVVFALCLVAMIFLIAKCKVHAVMSLLVVTIILGIAIGTPLGEIEGVINKGFADTIKSVGIVILLGCILGKLLEETGAAQAITKSAIKIVGKKNIIWAIGFSAFVLGIRDLQRYGYHFVIPIVSNLALETGTSMMAFGSALAVGAQITHSLVPPTPDLSRPRRCSASRWGRQSDGDLLFPFPA